MRTKAAICVEPGRPLEIDMVDVRAPGEGEVLVEMRATGLCHSDLHAMTGQVSLCPYPVILGHEGAGVVVDIGPGVTSVAPGDHVIPAPIPECRRCANCRSGRTNLCTEFFDNMANPAAPFSRGGAPIFQFAGTSTFANHTLVRESVVVKIRPDAPLDTVCYAGCGVATGVGAVRRTADVWQGASVVVFGIGGIGFNVLQGARLAGAARIIAVDINPGREALARRCGATDFVDPRGLDIVGHILHMTDGGADFSFECVGNVALTRQAIECTRPGWGVSVAIGAAPEADDIRLNSMLILSGRTWKGSMLGDLRPRTDLPGLIDLFMDGRLDLESLITQRLPFDRINDGFDMMRSGQAIRTILTF